MISQCEIIYQCNYKRMFKCKYHQKNKKDINTNYNCLSLNGGFCTNFNAMYDALIEEIDCLKPID